LGNPPFTLGWQFSVLNPINVTHLGIFDSDQNGLTDNYEVGIWDSVGTLLGSTVVGTGDPLTNQFRYSSVASINLAPGDYTIGGLYLTGNDGLIGPGGFGTASNFATDPNIAFVGPRFAAGGTLTNPTGSGGTDAGYFGPNFQFTAAAAAVPEPGSLAIFGIAFVCSAGFGFYRKRTLSKNS
jgi:hypothetical protein